MVERAARALLVLLVGLNVYGLFHPELRPQDQGVQTIVIFILALLVGLAFPRVRLWWIEIFLICFTLSVETAQYFGRMVGEAQVADLVSDVIGTTAAVLIVAWIRRRRRRKPPASG
jgi:hypothetical protein